VALIGSGAGVDASGSSGWATGAGLGARGARGGFGVGAAGVGGVDSARVSASSPFEISFSDKGYLAYCERWILANRGGIGGGVPQRVAGVIAPRCGQTLHGALRGGKLRPCRARVAFSPTDRTTWPKATRGSLH
jgi:hypothetical protein